jgi:hypothetical protein
VIGIAEFEPKMSDPMIIESDMTSPAAQRRKLVKCPTFLDSVVWMFSGSTVKIIGFMAMESPESSKKIFELPTTWADGWRSGTDRLVT